MVICSSETSGCLQTTQLQPRRLYSSYSPLWEPQPKHSNPLGGFGSGRLFNVASAQSTKCASRKFFVLSFLLRCKDKSIVLHLLKFQVAKRIYGQTGLSSEQIHYTRQKLEMVSWVLPGLLNLRFVSRLSDNDCCLIDLLLLRGPRMLLLLTEPGSVSNPNDCTRINSTCQTRLQEGLTIKASLENTV
jgi:hypothetical protein